MTERAGRLLLAAVVLGAPLAVFAIQRAATPSVTVTLHARMAADGGWSPDHLIATVDQPLRLRLTSDDVMHGFAVGRTDLPVVNVEPGQVREVTLNFTRPGRYVFYCTRWCGVDHWRMRGTIDVTGASAGDAGEEAPPLYVRLGLDLDAPHPADPVPVRRPSASRGARLGVTIPPAYRSPDHYRSQSPADLWRSLRDEAVTRALSDEDVWDLVALIVRSHSTPAAVGMARSPAPEAAHGAAREERRGAKGTPQATSRGVGRSPVLEDGRRLYAANCAACHGERGAGDGVMAAAVASRFRAALARHELTGPANLADPVRLLGASPALLQGKIVRGGMGTGMPYWGPIFTEAQTWALVDYLRTFQMDLEDQDE